MNKYAVIAITPTGGKLSRVKLLTVGAATPRKAYRAAFFKLENQIDDGPANDDEVIPDVVEVEARMPLTDEAVGGWGGTCWFAFDPSDTQFWIFLLS